MSVTLDARGLGLTADKRTTAAVRTRSSNDSGAADLHTDDSQVAAALRSAYEEAVKEDVPAEFLDLLGKLS